MEFFGLANGLVIDADGWALIPFGDSRHSGMDARQEAANAKAAKGEKEKPVIQRFDRASAEALVNAFKSGLGAIKRATIGLPIFKGHPDATRFARLFPDKTPRGTIADMEVVNSGLRLRPVLTDAGAADVESGWSDFSPYWLLHRVGEEDGMAVLSPFQLKSIGLVPKGNIAGLSLINAALSGISESTMKTNLIQLLTKLGYAVPADASDEQIVGLANKACTDCDCDAAANADVEELKKTSPTVPAQRNALVADCRKLKAEKTTAETALANAKVKVGDKEVALANAAPAIQEIATARTSAETERDSLKTKFESERKAHATALVNAAIVDGRVVAAEKEATVTALVNAADFQAEVVKLAGKAKVLRTASEALRLGTERGPGVERHRQIVELVNARMEKTHEDYTTAFTAVQSDPKHAALFPTEAHAPEKQIKFPRR